jgi:hypothetical protein
MKNDEERQGKRRKFWNREKVPGVSIKKALNFANKEKSHKTKNQKFYSNFLFHLGNFVIFRGLNFVNDAIVSTRKNREN